MGEIAEMMLDGTLCEGCGVYLEEEAEGFPRYCSPECAQGRGLDFEKPRPPKTRRYQCTQCSKRFRSLKAQLQHQHDAHGKILNRPKCPACGQVLKNQQGLLDHMRDKHSQEQPHDR